MNCNFLILLLFSLLAVTLSRNANQDEVIHAHIFNNYNKAALPNDEATVVQMNLLLLNIEDVDPFEGTIRLKIGLEALWTDSRLKFNGLVPATTRTMTYAFSDFKHGQSVVWVPDFEYNGGSRTNFYREMDPQYVEIYSDGSVYYYALGHITLTFDPSQFSYPYTSNHVEFCIGPWMQSKEYVDIQPYYKDRTSFHPEQKYYHVTQWEATDLTAERQDSVYTYADGSSTTYGEMKYTFNISRAKKQFGVLVFLPCLFLSLLTCLFIFMRKDLQLSYMVSVIIA